MPATTGSDRPSRRNRKRTSYPRSTPTRRKTSAPSPAPKPDVTLGGDRSPNRSGHAPARRIKPPSQGHPSQGRPTVSGGTKKNPRTRRYKTKTPSVRKQRREKRQRAALLKYTRRSLSGFKTPMRDPDTKILGVNVEAELEGRGVLQKASKFIQEHNAKNAGAGGLTAGGLGGGPGNEVADLAANLPSGVYLTGAAAKEAVYNKDSSRAKKLWKDYKKTSAIPAALSGDFKEAAKRAGEHPIATALEVSGAKALVGRNAGRVMRSGALGPKAKRVASTERADLRLYPDNLGTKGPTERRQYSKDVITKGAQVAAERRARRKGRDPNVDSGDAIVGGVPVPGGRDFKETRHKVADKQPRRSRLMRRVDTREFAGNRVRSERITRAKRETSMITPVGRETRFPGARRKGMVSREESPLVHLMAEKTVTSVKTARAEMRARLRQLDREHGTASRRHPAFARANRAEHDSIKALLNLDDAALNRVYLAAQEFSKQEASRQSRLRESGQYTLEEQATRWMPYLQSHHKLSGKELRQAAVALEKGAERVKVGNKIIRRPAEEPAFITQRPVRLTAKGTAPEAYQPAMQGVGASAPPGGKRSGEAYALGAREVGSEALVRQAIMSEGRASAGENFQALANEFGIPAGKDGRLYADSYNEALLRGKALVEDAAGALKPGQRALVPINIDGLRGFGKKLEKLQEKSKPGGFDDALAETMAEALNAESGRGRWILMPEDVVQQLRDHANVRTSDLAGATNLFKDVVLTSSSPTTWLTGNVSDLAFRSIMEGIRPTDVVRGRAIVRRMETKGLQGEQAAAAIAGGGFFHASSLADRFNPMRMNEHVARTVAAAPWRAWKGGVYMLEHFVEELPQFGRIGKAARQGDLGAADAAMKGSLRSLLRLQDEQVDFYATRLSSDRALEARIQGLTEDVIGRWGKISPRMRKYLAAAPFVQWLGASLRYTLVTLPTRHPVKTAIFAGIMEMTAEERARFGLSYLIPQDQRVQDYQMGTLPMSVKKGKYGLEVSGIRTGNLTSFGTAGQAVLGTNLPGFLLPQLRGAYGALTGQGFTGEDMVYPDWWPDKELRGLPLSAEDKRQAAIGSLLEVMIPFSSAFRRAVLEKGQPSLPQSTILSPQVRKRWDKEHKEWRADEGSTFGGISEWLNPIANSKLLTHGAVGDIKKSQETGRVFGRMRDKGDAEVRKLGGPRAVKVNQRLRDIRKAKQKIIEREAKHGVVVDSDNPTPAYKRLHLEERRLNEKLYRLTVKKGGKDGAKGHHYTKPYAPSGDGNPYGAGGDNPYADTTEANPYEDSGDNPYATGSGGNPYGN